MRLLSCFIALLIAGNVFAGINCGINISSTVTAPLCASSNDGRIDLRLSGGSVPQTSTKGLLISEFMADPTGSDSPFEFVELLATKTIDFSVTPYTVILNNNGIANASGWRADVALTYAFQISSGTVGAGDVLYVGGSSMIPTSGIFRAINTSTVVGDNGGNSNANGILGNGGSNADGIAVFDMPVASITSSTAPIDAIFFGTAIGQAFVTTTTGYQLPTNDHYSGGKLQSNSFLINNPISGLTQKATGVYDVVTNAFTTPRTWVNNATFSGGTSNVSLGQLYSYAWSNSETTQNISGLAGGQYCVTMTDVSSCTVSECFNVIAPDDITLNLIFLNASCFGLNDGGANTTLFGGTPSFSFAWSNGATTQNLSGVVADEYFLTVTDANNCTAEATAFISEPNEIIIDLEVSEASCSNAADGAVLTTITNGFPNFSFEWGNGATTQDITELIAGSYNLTVTDDFQCTATATAVIEELENIDFEVNTNNVSCFGGDNGYAAVFNVTGGSGNFTFDYSILTGEIGITDGTGNAAEITAGEYRVVIYEPTNPTCGLQKTFFITQPDELILAEIITDASSASAADGAITLNITGGTTPYSVVWSNSNNGEIINNLVVGNYCATVTDDAGCEADACYEVDFAVGINALQNGFANNAAVVNYSFFANILYAKTATLSIEVYSINGALMFTETKVNSSELSVLQNTSSWAKGIYMVRFSANNNSAFKRVIVQ